MCRGILGAWQLSFCAQFWILRKIPNVVPDHIFRRAGLWRRLGLSGFPAWNVATLGAEFQAGAGPERDVKYRERGLWETAAGRLSRANPAQARDRVPRFRPAGPVSTPSPTPLPSLRPKALWIVSPSQPSARPNGRSGASVSAKGLARISQTVRGEAAQEWARLWASVSVLKRLRDVAI